jgi:hypothetical protein
MSTLEGTLRVELAQLRQEVAAMRAQLAEQADGTRTASHMATRWRSVTRARGIRGCRSPARASHGDGQPTELGSGLVPS